jgi:hypothetical protein
MGPRGEDDKKVQVGDRTTFRVFNIEFSGPTWLAVCFITLLLLGAAGYGYYNYIYSKNRSEQQPMTIFKANPTSGEAPLSVSFDATDSNDPDGTIVTYSWDFGDGTTGSGATASHTYSSPDTYTAALTVTDDAGQTATATSTITVKVEPPSRNLALGEGAKAWQSSTRDPVNGAEKAIDGNTDGNFWHNSVSCTADEPNSWWQLQLPSTALIERIEIWNRTDECCRDRLSNLRISVLGESSEQVWVEDFRGPISHGNSKLFEVPRVRGRYVKVQILGKNLGNNGVLTLAEVEVFGKFTK